MKAGLTMLLACFLACANADSLTLSLVENPVVASMTDKEAYQHYLELANEYYTDKEDYRTAIFIYKKASEIAIKLKDESKILVTYIKIARGESRISNMPEALEYFTKAKNILQKETGDQKKLADVYDGITKVYTTTGNYDKAYETALKSLEICENIGDSVGMASSNYEIGSIFFYQKNYDRALEFYQEVYKICSQQDHERCIFSSTAAIGSTLNKVGKTKESLTYNLKSLRIAKKMDYKTGIGYAYNNVGADYLSLKQYDRALEYLEKSLVIKEELKDESGLCGTLMYIAEAQAELDSTEQSLISLQRALSVATENKLTQRIKETYQSLSKIYHKSGKSDSAFIYLQKYMHLNDSLFNEETLSEITKAQNSFEVHKKEKEIMLLTKDKEIHEIRNRFYFICLLVALGLIWMVYRNYKNQYKNNQLLETKNTKIKDQNSLLKVIHKRQLATNNLLEEKNELIEAQNRKLEHSNRELEHFAYMASHDMKEPLRTIGSYTNLLRRRFKDKINDPAAEEFMNFITDATDRMQVLLEDLLWYSRAGTQKGKVEIVDTYKTAELVVHNLNHQVNSKNAKVLIDPLPNVVTNKNQLHQLFQNLISNGIKYNESLVPTIAISAKENETEYIFSVQDNGIGIKDEYKQEIFEMFRRLHTRNDYEGTGIGLATVKKIIDAIGGKIWVDSEENQGSTFYFTIPKQDIDSPKVQKSDEMKIPPLLPLEN